ncbi:GHKL domain-containing protein [bacterium]|nr:GHKL domain-containing protein [bacterium]
MINNPPDFKSRVEKVYKERFRAIASTIDPLFGYLLLFQWFVGVLFALTISPLTWEGDVGKVHLHVYTAVFLGGALALYPAFLVFSNPGAPLNRMVISFAQILFSVLFIHLTGGRIETHFHIFGSLAFLAFYKDWRPLAIATIITTLDHLVRGFYWPQSVYGVLSSSPWRAFEHAGWVLFEDMILLYSIRVGLRDLRTHSETHVKLEETILNIEEKVHERTKQLQDSQKTVMTQQQALISSAKMSALGEMAGGIAHEINTPLASIRNISSQIEEVVDDEVLDRQLVKEMALKLVKTTDRIGKIVQGMRAFSRESTSDSLRPTLVQQIIEETLGFCQERFSGHGIEISFENKNPHLKIAARATEISQVLLNLLNNSHDAVMNLPEKWIRIAVTERDKNVEIRITDSGKGIPVEVQKKIFQPFFTTKPVGSGTGLGLSISLGIIRGHKGELRLDNNSSNTCFVIQLIKSEELSIPAA